MRITNVTTFALAAVLSASCTTEMASSESERTGAPIALSISAEARSVLAAARASTRPLMDAAERRRLAIPAMVAQRPAATPLLDAGPARAFVREGDRIRAEFGSAAASGAALDSSLPADASGIVHLQARGVTAGVRLLGASTAPAELAGDGYVVYRNALDGADVLHRPGPTSEEDFIVLDRERSESHITYEVSLERGVRAVRLMANTIELLDDRGVPRLRMAPPYLADAAGSVQFLDVAVEGCNVDTGATPPWERTVPLPNANSCRVTVSWNARAVKYPLVIDPSWTTTASMILPRYFHTSTTLNNGRVLVAGGETETGVVHNTAELFDPAFGVWIPAAPMAVARTLFPAVRLSSGRVLVAGGFAAGLRAIANTELYDPSTGVWLRGGSLGTARGQQTGTLLDDNTVLVAGGVTTDLVTGAGTGLATCERYFEATNSWSATGSLNVARFLRHTANLLADGRVLVAAGGQGTWSTVLAAAELYSPSAGTWSNTGSLATGREGHASALLPGDKVLVAGGVDSSQNMLASAEVFDPTANSGAGAWSAAPSMATARAAFTATRLPGTNNILVAGGAVVATFPAPVTATAELYKPSTATWATTVSMNVARSDHTASLVGGGVLVAGGAKPGGAATSFTALSDAEIYQP